MACAPHTCSYHNTGTSTCSGHRGTCGTNRTLSWYAYENETITAARVDELRYKIRDEVYTWNQHAWYETGLTEAASITAGQPITNELFNNLDNMVGYIYGGYVQDMGDGYLIDNLYWDQLMDRYNSIRQNCICNSDCACNAICACYGDCGCNYSDERLKHDIEYC